MEMMFKIASKILMWIGWIALGAMGIAMLVFGFVGSMIAIAVLAVENGGDPSPIFFIMRGVQFMWQFAFIMFLFAGLMWSFSLIARSLRAKRQRELEEIAEEIKFGVQEEYVDLNRVKPKMLKSRRRK